MVTNITSLTGNGLKDWLIQRITEIYLALYVIFCFAFFLSHSHLIYEQWHALFVCMFFKISTILALFALCLHSWIGIWTVTTDYLPCKILRLSIQIIVILWLLSQSIWGLMIVWGQ